MEKNIHIYDRQPTHKVPDNLFGLFLEDINFSCDGGLSANMINNHSFDGFYPQKGASMVAGLLLHQKLQPVYDRLRFWEVNGDVIACHEKPLYADGWFARLSGSVTLKNKGFNGGKKYKDACAVSIEQGKAYEFICDVRSVDFRGELRVWVEDEKGTPLTDTQSVQFAGEWSTPTVILMGNATKYGRLCIESKGDGTLDLDEVRLYPAETWGKGDPKWEKTGRVRYDLAKMLADIHPKFMRFPGGGLISGLYDHTEYHWKDSVGPLGDRKTAINMPWGANQSGYLQSYQFGFHEFFLLCEDLGMEPVPVCWIGMNGREQFITRKGLDFDSAEYKEQVIDNFLDLIEYATGDPETSKWAKMRADLGHPKPFSLKYLGIGNENTGDYYSQSFLHIEKAVHEKYPDIKLIMTTGSFYGNKACQKQSQFAIDQKLDVLLDGHTYSSPKWFLANAGLFDKMDRKTPHLFLGEYAAGNSYSGNSKNPNSYESALAEAAFMTGIERNSDYVDMACYAPLLNMLGGTQWRHNLIDFNQKAAVRSTNYLVQKMFGSNMGTEVLSASLAAEDGVYLSATGSKEAVFVKLVNANAEPCRVTINFETALNGQAAVEFIQSDDLSVRNSIDFEGDPVEPIKLQTSFVTVTDGQLTLNMQKNSFYAIRILR